MSGTDRNTNTGSNNQTGVKKPLPKPDLIGRGRETFEEKRRNKT